MTQEEKAKAYDRVSKEVKDFFEGKQKMYSDVTKTLEYLFPELKESENGLTWLTKYIEEEIYCLSMDIRDNEDRTKLENLKKSLAWLEKQGKREQDPCENCKVSNGNDTIVLQKDLASIGPKFHEGDWFVNNISQDTYLIKSVNNGYCTLEDTKGNIISPCLPPCESESHLWSISDAKDGDILVNGSNIFMFHFINDTRLMGYCHVNTDDGRFYDDIGRNECFCLIDAVVNPASKEQRGLLFKAMADAGYEWDAKKKELKIMDWSKYIKYEPNSPSITKENPAWSEEDERIYYSILADIRGRQKSSTSMLETYYSEQIGWLRLLKERYAWKPSDDQIEALDWALSLAKNCGEECAFDLGTLQEQLNKLKV